MHNYEYFAKDNFAFFKGRETEAEQIAAITYIAKLAAQSSTDISKWDLTTYFADFTKLDKAEINKRFFEARELAKPAKVQRIADKVVEQIREMAKSFRRGARTPDVVKAEISQQVRQIRDYQEALNSTHRVLANLSSELEVLETKKTAETDWAGMIEAIEADGFFKFNGAFSASRPNSPKGERYFKGLEFETVAEVWVRYKNEAQMVDANVNFGKFRVTYNGYDGAVYFGQAGNNIVCSGCPHPHISEHTMCFGATADEASRLLARHDLPNLYRLVASILTVYNNGNPYVNITSYARAREAQKPKAPAVASARPLEEPDEEQAQPQARASRTGNLEQLLQSQTMLQQAGLATTAPPAAREWVESVMQQNREAVPIRVADLGEYF